jgi:hypothetical protein
VAEAIKALEQATNSSAAMFLGGHSLGGAMVQTLAQAHSAQGNTPRHHRLASFRTYTLNLSIYNICACLGLLLTGSFLARKSILPLKYSNASSAFTTESAM